MCQILIAEVSDSGKNDGVLHAKYTSDFPGEYLVFIEEVELKNESPNEGRPITGSPFVLTIAGSSPALDISSLQVCGSEGDSKDDIAGSFWRPGTWLSSNVASAAHGVGRDGWVFQPKNCVIDMFSYEELMLLASPEQDPTWLLVLGGSVQRGVFLTLVDMVLAEGQKDKFGYSAAQK